MGLLDKAEVRIKPPAFLLIVGGAIGTLLGVSRIVYALLQGPANVPQMLIATSVFAASTWAGVALWRGNDKAHTAATILYIAQLPAVSGSGFLYQFSTGLNLMIIDRGTSFGLSFYFGSIFQAGSLQPTTEPLLMGLNIVPIFMLLFLWSVPRPLRPARNRPPASSHSVKTESNPTSPDTRLPLP